MLPHFGVLLVVNAEKIEKLIRNNDVEGFDSEDINLFKNFM